MRLTVFVCNTSKGVKKLNDEKDTLGGEMISRWIFSKFMQSPLITQSSEVI